MNANQINMHEKISTVATIAELVVDMFMTRKVRSVDGERVGGRSTGIMSQT